MDRARRRRRRRAAHASRALSRRPRRRRWSVRVRRRGSRLGPVRSPPAGVGRPPARRHALRRALSRCRRGCPPRLAGRPDRGHTREAVVEQNRAPAATGACAPRSRPRGVQALPGSPEVDALTVAIGISAALNRAEIEGVDVGLAAIEAAAELAGRLGDPALLVACAQPAWRSSRSGPVDYDRALSEFAAAEESIDHADANDRFAILLNAGALRLSRVTSPGRDVHCGAPRPRARCRNARRTVQSAAQPRLRGVPRRRYARRPSAHGRGRRHRHVVSRGVWLLDRSRVLAEAGTRACCGKLTRAGRRDLPSRAAGAGSRRDGAGTRPVRAHRRRDRRRAALRDARPRPVPQARQRPVAAQRRTRPVAG